MGTDTKADPNTLKSVTQAFEVIDVLREKDGAGVSEIADELGWAKSTTHNYLRTLEENEYIVSEGSTYCLGLRFLDLGNYVLNRKPLYSLVEPKVEELAEKTGERVQFAVLEHRHAVYVCHEKGERGVQTDVGVGSRINLHATSGGKALLSQLPTDELEAVLDRIELQRFTKHTITDKDEFRDELEHVREENMAYSFGEMVEGLNAVAVPVTDAAGKLLGSLSISGPAHRFTDHRLENELTEYLLGTANELELNIEYL